MVMRWHIITHLPLDISILSIPLICDLDHSKRCR